MKQLALLKHVRLGTLFILSILMVMEITARPTNPMISLYSVEDGMSANIVNCIVKDASGFIWISQADNTISRFDGYGFSSYPLDENKGWNGSQSWRGGLSTLSNGNFRISSRNSITEYDIRSDRFFEFLEVIYRENPGIKRLEGQCHLQKDTVWFFENDKIRKLEPEKYPAKGYKETVFHLDNNIGKVTCTQERAGGELWIGTKNGIFLINHDSGKLKLTRCTILLNNKPSPSQNVWKIIFINSNMWFISNDGIINARIQIGSDTTGGPLLRGEAIIMDRPEIDFTPSYYPLNMVSDGSEYIFIRTSMGIYRYSIQNNRINRLFSEPVGTEDWPRGHYQFALLYDDRGLLWAGSRKGLLKINLGNKKFLEISSFQDKDKGLTGFNPSQVLVDRNRRLWVGTTSNGLYMSLPDDNGAYQEFFHFLSDTKDSTSLFSPEITYLFEDSKNNIYVASGINAGKVQQIIIDDNNVSFRKLNGPGRILWMLGLPDGKIFLTPSQDPGWIYDPETDKGFPFYPHKKKIFYQRMLLHYTSDHNCYLKVGNGENIEERGVFEITGELQFSDGDDPAYYPDQIRQLLDHSAINSMLTFHVTESPDYTEFWMFGNGVLYRYRLANDHKVDEKPVLIKVYDENDGLKTKKIYELLEDKQHRIWLTSPNGLFCLNPQTDEVLRYNIEDGLCCSDFYWGKHLDESGNLFFCCNEGVIYFHPDSIIPDRSPPVYITGMNIFNEALKPGADSPLKQSVMLTDEVVLSHHQNSISFEFVALDFTNTKDIEYRYYLEGIEKKWIYAGENHIINYAYLKPGNYTFRVVAGNSNGVWNEVGDSLHIRIKPPPWFSWWAFSIYTLLLLWIILWYRKYLQNKAILTAQLEIERIEKEKSQEMGQMRSRFFANISHEFRTPLSLILGPVEDLLGKQSEEVLVQSTQLKVIKRNATRLKRLISQLLDLSKLETGKVKLNLQEGNLTKYIRSIVYSFCSLAESREIEYTFDLQSTPGEVWFDPDKLDKITTNLISNAFKFTPHKGRILITLRYETKEATEEAYQLVLTVEDSGKGIPDDQRLKIFDRYYQINSSENNGPEGSGIGLALTKELVDVHRGFISVESKIGKGTRFRVELPVSKTHFSEEDLNTRPDEIHALDIIEGEYQEEDREGILEKLEEEPIQKNEALPVILIVEDHKDLRNYIKQHLSSWYQLHEAGNGKTGLKIAIDIIPDLVITDLMMPEMDGMEMCQRIKEDERTNHIPVIMLTARADQQSKLDGLKTGADNYLIKPFDSEELKVRVKNLIDQRNKLQEKFSSAFFAFNGRGEIKSADDLFLQKAVEIVNDHISDDKFTVEMFCSSLGMSNSQINRKLQAITGLTPSLFIRNLRLRQSLLLLEKGYDNIARIAFEVGFSDHSYYSKCFRELYSSSPTEYIIRRNSDSAK